MPRVLKRPALVLTAEEKECLDQWRQSRTAAMRDVQRAQILWRYQSGETVAQIARAVNTTRNSALKWIDKALQLGVMTGIKDTPHKPREAVITDDAKAWVVHLACAKPKDLGYAAELWTRSALAGHVRTEAVAAGFPALAKAGKATIQRILAAQELQPHKIRYYLERRDPDFESKMRIVLLVYKEVAIENEAAGNNGGLRETGGDAQKITDWKFSKSPVDCDFGATPTSASGSASYQLAVCVGSLRLVLSVVETFGCVHVGV